MIVTKLQEIKNEVQEKLNNDSLNLQSLMELKGQYLGKKSVFQEIMVSMKDLPNSEKPVVGKLINEAKQAIEAMLDEKRRYLEEKAINEKLTNEAVDVTLPGKAVKGGSKHLLNQIVEEIEDLFIGMGYVVKTGPEVELDEFNFERLNLPKDHPARDMQDTFYITNESLLRTHTSPVQARTMLEYGGKKPVKVICPGKVYRRDDDDATHSHQFMQIEGLVVDKHVTLANLKATLLEIAKKMFGEERTIRLRPSYFPFTEPSVEVDISCYKCGGEGCPLCKHTGWIEILGAGMVHNNVLVQSGYDPNVYQGFAFGIGVERVAMLKYGIDDIRHFYTNDLRFNKQFK